ncbi:MAG: GntR family transcriptional regulator [Candidatus Promineofilum sp.]|nr:GntR family transcriptional regulator [Promineifilum sp.]
MLKRAPSLTDQVKTHVREMIVRGDFADGRVPPEMELAEALGVSRTTIRDALSRLEMEGTISRKQGAGTFVNNPTLQIHSRLDEIWSYEAMLRAYGFTPSTRVLESTILTVGDPRIDDVIVADLGLASDEQVLFISKLFMKSDLPAILADNYLPLRLISEPYAPEDLGLAIYDFLERFSRQRLTYYLSEIIPLAAQTDMADTLQIPAGTPLISFDETGYNAENEPILKAFSYFRDDLLRFRLLRRRV